MAGFLDKIEEVNKEGFFLFLLNYEHSAVTQLLLLLPSSPDIINYTFKLRS